MDEAEEAEAVAQLKKAATLKRSACLRILLEGWVGHIVLYNRKMLCRGVFSFNRGTEVAFPRLKFHFLGQLYSYKDAFA